MLNVNVCVLTAAKENDHDLLIMRDQFRRHLKEQFTQQLKFSHIFFIHMLMETWVKFHGPRNIREFHGKTVMQLSPCILGFPPLFLPQPVSGTA